MADPLSDEFNLRLLRHLVSGSGVSVNINALSKLVGIHRNTAREKVEFLFNEKILTPPTYPFLRLYDEYPLLVLAWADIPHIKEAIDFFLTDSHIFAAFSCMEGPYNTFLVEFFKDMESYHSWREGIVKENRLPPRENRAPAEVMLLSNRLMVKNDPRCLINEMRKVFRKNGKLELGDISMDRITFQVFEAIVGGECIRLNETALAGELASNRKAVVRRTRILIDEGVLGHPACYFPNLLVPHGYNLIVSLMEVKDRKDEFGHFLLKDNHVPRALRTSSGRYNFVIFSAFRTVEEFFDWGEDIFTTFPGTIGAIDNTLISPKMIHPIQGQKVSLGLIERKLRELGR